MSESSLFGRESSTLKVMSQLAYLVFRNRRGAILPRTGFVHWPITYFRYFPGTKKGHIIRAIMRLYALLCCIGLAGTLPGNEQALLSIVENSLAKVGKKVKRYFC